MDRSLRLRARSTRNGPRGDSQWQYRWQWQRGREPDAAVGERRPAARRVRRRSRHQHRERRRLRLRRLRRFPRVHHRRTRSDRERRAAPRSPHRRRARARQRTGALSPIDLVGQRAGAHRVTRQGRFGGQGHRLQRARIQRHWHSVTEEDDLRRGRPRRLPDGDESERRPRAEDLRRLRDGVLRNSTGETEGRRAGDGVARWQRR